MLVGRASCPPGPPRRAPLAIFPPRRVVAPVAVAAGVVDDGLIPTGMDTIQVVTTQALSALNPPAVVAVVVVIVVVVVAILIQAPPQLHPIVDLPLVVQVPLSHEPYI